MHLWDLNTDLCQSTLINASHWCALINIKCSGVCKWAMTSAQPSGEFCLSVVRRCRFASSTSVSSPGMLFLPLFADMGLFPCWTTLAVWLGTPFPADARDLWGWGFAAMGVSSSCCCSRCLAHVRQFLKTTPRLYSPCKEAGDELMAVFWKRAELN